TTTTTTTVPTTTKTPGTREQLLSILTEGRVATIYETSYNSIFNRIRDNGFMKESLTGLYQGEYVRSIGALAILADKVGEIAAAGKTLKFVTDVMKKKNLTHVPFTISADGNTVRTEDELDGRAHFVLGWALYVQKSGDTAYFNDTYALMKREADAFCISTYFYEDVGLVRNRRLTHTRMYNGSDYHDAFDILTNSFTAAALEQMIAVAKKNGKETDAVLWQDTLAKLKKGIAKNLTRTVNGKTVYLEQRYFRNKTAENGVSWVCFAPFVTGYGGLDDVVLQNTATYARSVLWKKTANGGYLAVESNANGTVKNWILGKSVGWDLAAAATAGDTAHILDALRFLEANHTGNLYMEKMQPNGSTWKTIDAGNAEQVIWFLYGIAAVREAAGLSAKP
ncbi:MAG: hypothetical protein J6L00_04935, partial [Clostridia bacterium]|nr:hypothetical protein [Clostridia bacterium]